jgi:cysteine desulfurase NifS/selenium donor protein
MNPVYLDYNATTPIAPEVADAMRPYLDIYFGNPSSSHKYGSETKLAVEKARKQLAKLLNCEVSEIIFTSGGTESNNYAIKGVAFANKHKGNHIITSTIEHPAVFEVCQYLEKQGFEITYLPVNAQGLVSPDAVEQAITSKTILITIMHANNEVGTIQLIESIGQIAKKHNILFHTDAAQSIGKIPVNVKTMDVQMLSVAGHKLYAPKGIGALYLQQGVKLEKLIHGADHEQNLRAGTENVLEIVGLGKAAEISQRDLNKNILQLKETRDYLWKLLQKELPNCQRNGHPELCLPNTLSVSFPGIEANTLISRLSNVAASAGAACHSESIDVSAVLEAMKVPINYAMGTIRFSTGRDTQLKDIKLAATEIIETVKNLMPKERQNSTKAIHSKNIQLTQFTHGLGCACKIKPQSLEKVLKSLPPVINKNVLIGTENSDDAAVYLINKDQALVQTLDFFTPIVDDPYDFGAIAAANALSDIYAMGAQPIFALNIVAFPENTLPLSVLEQILLGASDKATEAGIPILGGHTIEDSEPKFGMVVSGLVHPDKVYKNNGAQPGDVLVLTKPLGTGILSTALKRGLVDDSTKSILIEQMKTLNKQSASLLKDYIVHACTDVTGFGLIGHLREMLSDEKTSAELYFDQIPYIEGAKDLAAAGVIPGGTFNNLEFSEALIDFGSLGRTQQLLLADAQTSGGLLVAMPKNDAQSYLTALQKDGNLGARIIGNIVAKKYKSILLL